MRNKPMLTFIICCLASCAVTTYSSKKNIVSTPDKNIYTIILNDYYYSIVKHYDFKPLILVLESTYFKSSGNYINDSIFKHIPDTPTVLYLAESLINLNRDTFLIDELCFEKASIVFLSKKQAEIIAEKMVKEKKNLDDFYPNNSGIISFSRVPFSKDSTFAFCYLEALKNGLNAYGVLYVLKNISNKYEIIDKILLWES